MAELYEYTAGFFYIRSPIEGHLVCFQFLVTVCTAVINVQVQFFVWGQVFTYLGGCLEQPKVCNIHLRLI